jgi:hypothetical protein
MRVWGVLTLAGILSLAGMPRSSAAFVCLPTEPAHSQGTAERWSWHHNLSQQLGFDCDSYVFLDPGESVQAPLHDGVNQPGQAWHIELKFDPSPDFAPCIRIFNEVYCPTGSKLTDHLTWPESPGMETVDAIARWTNNSTRIGLGFDSSVAERDTSAVFPPHDDIGGFVRVDELPPDGIIVFEILEQPTSVGGAGDEISWGTVKTHYR